MRRVGKIVMVALFATAVWTSSANAVVITSNNCQVQKASLVAVGATVMRIADLSDPPAFPTNWVVGVKPTASADLAIALTAISLGNRVRCRVDMDSEPRVLIFIIMTDVPL